MKRLPSVLSSLFTLLILDLLSAGCSMSGLVGTDVVQYQNAGGNAANEQLLINIVRAKNQEPLHFSQLTQIHGSANVSGGLSAAVPFGINSGNLNQNVGASAMFSQNPSFDIGTLDDQKFWKAIVTQPVSPDTIDQLIKNGNVDQRMAYLLFFSELHGTVHHENGDLLNNDTLSDGGDSNWFPYMKDVNTFSSWGALHVHRYRELIPLGPPKADLLQIKDLTGLDQSKFAVKYYGKSSQLYSISNKSVYCVRANVSNSYAEHFLAFPASSPPSYQYGQDEIRSICSSNDVIVPSGERPSAERTLQARSVFGIIEYLGMVLRYQDSPEAVKNNWCITLDSPQQHDKRGHCNNGEVLFRTYAKRPGKSSVIADYGGKEYYLASYDANCGEKNDPDPSGNHSCDRSSQVLSTVALLLNLNKDIQDVPSTPTVRNVLQ